MELNKYMIHGYFEMFEMKEYYAYFGFEKVNVTLEDYEDMREGKGVMKNGDISTFLFCTVRNEN